jgi:hypothetical protein
MNEVLNLLLSDVLFVCLIPENLQKMKLGFFNDNLHAAQRPSVSLQLPPTGSKMSASVADLKSVGQRRIYIPDHTTVTSLIADMAVQTSDSKWKERKPSFLEKPVECGPQTQAKLKVRNVEKHVSIYVAYASKPTVYGRFPAAQYCGRRRALVLKKCVTLLKHLL